MALRWAAASAACALLCTAPAIAEQWVFRPSVGLDQRFDDNFSLVPIGADELSATRLIGDLRLARETARTRIEGTLRGDLRIEVGDTEDTAPQANGIALFDVTRLYQRGRLNFDARITRDTPSDDIVSDVTDLGSVPVDSGVVTQNFDVERTRADLSPSFVYQLSRRSSLEGSFSFSTVTHELPSVQDTLFDQYLRLLAVGENPPTPETRPELFDENGNRFTRENITSAVTGVFSPTGELDDFTDTGFRLGYRYALDRISSVSFFAGFSRFVAEEEVDPSALVFEDLIAFGDGSIRRAPRADTVDTTTSFTVGYDRLLDPTLRLAVQAGVYTNTSDDTERFRRNDGTLVEGVELESDEDGFLASISLEKDAGLTRYSARFAVDVLPSSAGSRVETNELTGQVFRTLTRRINISLRGQAYEPDRLGTQANDRFARRFISLEPRIIWRFTRDWTLGAAYRYRRQRARVDPESSESNALLFSVRYEPPSRLAEALGR